MRFRLTLLMVVAMVGSLVGQIAVVPAWAQGQEPPAVDEIVVDDQRYQFDQTVPIDVGTLQQVADADGTPVYTKPSDDPLGAVYTPGDTGARRYLPENLDAPQAVCAVATADVGQIEGAGFVYVPTGIEPDLAPEQLVEVGSTADGRTLYAPSTEQPFEQLYVSGADGGVVRYIAIGENGVPVTFPDRMIFAGQEFQLTAGETPDPSGFQQVGCALRFPALAAPGETPGAFTAVHVQAGDSLVTYRSVGPTEPATPAATEPPIAPVATEPQEPTVAPTVAPTEAPTVAPTETPVPTVAPTETPEPTVAPTDTPVPTAVPTETPEPTAVPTETPVPTVAPTETPLPTAVPTETPVPTETSEPTAAPTDTPAPTAAPTETPVPAAPPTETPEPAQAPQETQAPTPRPTPTPQVLQPRAVVPTLPPDAPPPPAATSAVAGCTGEAGPIGADGLPERLPEAFQYGGTGYRFAETVPIDELDDLDRIGCIGPFEVYDGEGETLYLTLSTIAESAWRYELTASFTVDLEVTDDPRLLILQDEDGDVRYRAGEPLVRSIYSSVSLILYVPDAEATQPARVLGYAVDHEVFGEYLPEGEAEPASQEVQERAEAMGIHPTMTIGTGTQTYVLVTLWEPFGTTTNGWLTLYAPAGEETPEQLVGIDPRRLDLPVFNRQ